MAAVVTQDEDDNIVGGPLQAKDSVRKKKKMMRRTTSLLPGDGGSSTERTFFFFLEVLVDPPPSSSSVKDDKEKPTMRAAAAGCGVMTTMIDITSRRRRPPRQCCLRPRRGSRDGQHDGMQAQVFPQDASRRGLPLHAAAQELHRAVALAADPLAAVHVRPQRRRGKHAVQHLMRGSVRVRVRPSPSKGQAAGAAPRGGARRRAGGHGRRTAGRRTGAMSCSGQAAPPYSSNARCACAGRRGSRVFHRSGS